MTEKFVDTVLVGGVHMRTHPKESCSGYWCPVHYPSPHHMREWKQDWTKGIMWRECQHHIYHPDPDDFRWGAALLANDPPSTVVAHAKHLRECDGCCHHPFRDKELS